MLLICYKIFTIVINTDRIIFEPFPKIVLKRSIMMKKLTKYYKKLNLVYIKISVLAVIVSAFFLPVFTKFEKTGDNIFTVTLNGEEVGVLGSAQDAQECLQKARAQFARSSTELILIDASLETKGEEVLVGRVDSMSQVRRNILSLLRKNTKETLSRSYTVKINEYTVNLASTDEVIALLQAAIDKYDKEGIFAAQLAVDQTRELNVLTTEMITKEEVTRKQDIREKIFTSAGVETTLSEIFGAVESSAQKGFDDYDLGLIDLYLADDVEVVEAYLMDSEITPLADAIEEVTKDQEKETIYEVQSGDTLSQIAELNGLTMDELIEMNEAIENENSMIRIGDEIIVTIPEPELSVSRVEEAYYEESYDAPVQYIDNDEWYTTDKVTLQEPSAGFRKVVADVSYKNNKEVAREIVKEEVVIESVPKIVERGTKIPPTYIKPVSGGRLSSGFGGRKAPTKGASTYHKGVDWSLPIGTAVMASSSGTVVKAGWGSGYGYVIYINHADGRQTRYGHLSKVLVKQGQYVQQGDKIALSGNTGRSTGPHLHFEILVGGSQVNPLENLD